ncbi:MAG: FtsX-like permease family protein, partial [Dehalococcoidia bacterium]
MDALFGLSMNTIMIVLVVMLAVCLAFVAFVALTNRIVFMMGLRNIPRRVAQTVLIVIGLMLSTVIITAAFATGDTVDYSVTKQTYDLLGHADVLLDGETGTLQPGQQDTNEIPGAGYQRFLDVADGTTFESIDGYAGVLYEPVPVIDTRTGLSEPAVAFSGVDADRLEAFPDIIDASSGEVLDVDNLADDEVYLNETAANELDADVGDPLQTFIFSQPLDPKVTAIVRDTGVAGGGDLAEPQGMVTSLDRLHELFGHDDVSLILVSATGGARPDLAVVDAAALEIEGLIEANNLNLEISDTKRDFVEEAESIGNFMTTFFLLLGLFSIGAGILLILMIFVMLAAERKSEMGMSRAIGMKRGQLVQMFVSEGGAYDIGSAFVGVFIGILVAFALTTAASAIFSTFGFTFTPHVTLRTAVVSFCLG